MKTWVAKPDEVERKWWIVDANGQTLGRMATQIATVLRGKNKPQFTPHVDTGDFVVVINADKIKLSGTKWEDKKYWSHSGFFGSIKGVKAAKMLETKPEQMIKFAVEGMLPKNRLSGKILTKLKVYKGAEYDQAAQQPQPLNIQ